MTENEAMQNAVHADQMSFSNRQRGTTFSASLGFPFGTPALHLCDPHTVAALSTAVLADEQVVAGLAVAPFAYKRGLAERLGAPHVLVVVNRLEVIRVDARPVTAEVVDL